MEKVEMKPGQKYYYIVLRYMTWESKMNVKEGTVPSDTDAWEKTLENLRYNFFLTKEDADSAYDDIKAVFESASLKVAQILEEDSSHK